MQVWTNQKTSPKPRKLYYQWPPSIARNSSLSYQWPPSFYTPKQLAVLSVTSLLLYPETARCPIRDHPSIFRNNTLYYQCRCFSPMSVSKDNNICRLRKKTILTTYKYICCWPNLKNVSLLNTLRWTHFM